MMLMNTKHAPTSTAVHTTTTRFTALDDPYAVLLNQLVDDMLGVASIGREVKQECRSWTNTSGQSDYLCEKKT